MVVAWFTDAMPRTADAEQRGVTAEPALMARPANRKALILDAAARTFTERGYHGASMDDIAAAVGITATALYRHFPNKYALFVDCTSAMIDRLLQAVDHLPDARSLTDLLRAVTTVTVDHRSSGGLYRWEGRYLQVDDRRVLRAKFGRLVDTTSAAIAAEDDASGADRLRAAAALGVIASITMHRTTIGQRHAQRLLVEAAARTALSDGPEPGQSPAVELPSPPVARTRRAQILAAAIPLLHQDGFANVPVSRIAQAVGVTPSAIYRHYPGKVDIVFAACAQAAALLAQAVDAALAGVTDPSTAVQLLACTYTAFSFEHTALIGVAEAEIVGLPADLQRPLVDAQRAHIAAWEEQLTAARPDLDSRSARTLIHAAFGAAVESGRELRWVDSAENRAMVSSLIVSALGV